MFSNLLYTLFGCLNANAFRSNISCFVIFTHCDFFRLYFPAFVHKHLTKWKNHGTSCESGYASFTAWIRESSKSTVMNLGLKLNSFLSQLIHDRYAWSTDDCHKTWTIGMYSCFFLWYTHIFNSCVNKWGHILKVPSMNKCRFGSFFTSSMTLSWKSDQK